MAGQIEIFSLYKLTIHNKNAEYVLVRTEQPSYSNASQVQEDLAYQIESQKRQLLLASYINLYAKDSQIEFMGELQISPFGDRLYLDKGLFKLPIFYQQTEYGKSWIILGNANSISDFEKELSDYSDLLSLKPTGPINQVEATLITENDFDLSEIKYYDAKDMRDL